VGVFILELDRAPIPKRWVEPAFVVDLVDEARKRVNDIGERLVAAEIDFLGLERLYKALCLGVVIGVAAPLASEVPKPSRNRRRTSCSTGAAALSRRAPVT
jgi:hypothetical protein